MSVLTRLLGRPKGRSEVEKQMHDRLARDRGLTKCTCEACGGVAARPQLEPTPEQVRRATRGIRPACPSGMSDKCWCATCTQEFNRYTQSLEFDHMRGRHG